MSRDVILYITASLDGFIADTEGSVEWLAGAEGENYGYAEFLGSVDTVLMGSHTWLDTLVLAPDDPYPDKRVIVFSSRTDLPVRGSVEFIAENPVAFTRSLKAQAGGPIWCVGGGELASALFSAGMIDELDVFVQPVVLGDGIPLWRTPLAPHRLELLVAKAWPGELAELRYRVLTEGD